MPGFDNQVMWCANMDFTDPTGTSFTHTGNFTTAGQIPIGTGIAAPGQQISVGTLTAGSGITINNGAGTITISASGGTGLAWSAISANQTLAINNGYFCTGGAALALALPAVSAVGDTIEVYLDGSTSFQITQSAGQTIKFGSQVTTGGVGGSITTTGQGDGLVMVCRTANLRWLITACMGNLTFV
jgi:hypothetical protein